MCTVSHRQQNLPRYTQRNAAAGPVPVTAAAVPCALRISWACVVLDTDSKGCLASPSTVLRYCCSLLYRTLGQ
jgi:hypothetical protein